ncbi:MAG TPA: aquaporin [Actinomycetota bacterium]|nr:aquaporin [Actinomycetota bacterium]
MEHIGRAMVAEFVATFAVVLVGAGAMLMHANGQLDLTGAALAYGSAIAVMVSITAHLSGGFASPAVAISMWVTGKVSTSRAGVLVAAELAGAIVGSYLLRSLVPSELFDSGNGGIPALGDGITIGKGILIEAVVTFLLVFAYFGTIVDDRGPFSKTAGITIGLAAAFGVMAFGAYTGAAANPARWLGPALTTAHWADWYVWIVGPVAGGIIAGVLYWGVFLKDREPATP